MMGLGIIGIVFIVLAIVVLIFYISSGEDTGEAFIPAAFVIGCCMLITTICITKYGKLETDYERQEYLIVERQATLDKIDEEHMTSEMLDAIQVYNNKVNNNNGRWIKWKPEDRSRFEIDYNHYRELFDEQMQSKINEGLGG